MGDYNDLYLKLDVLLLPDVSEEFWNVCLENNALDPAWYYITTPGLAIELELLGDPGILLMVEKGIRGGISMISNRFARPIYPYMDKNYDESKTTKYGVMCQPLHVKNFKWMQL